MSFSRSFLLLSALVCVSAVGCGSTNGSADGQADQSDDALTFGGEATPLLPDPQGSPTKHPIVLAHGFNASTTNSWAFYGVQEALAKEHPLVVLAEVPPFASPQDRAGYLAKDVDRALERCKTIAGCDASGVNIIAHSMGGLDARALIGTLHYGDRVKSLTTISSPHRGTAIADALLDVLPSLADDVVNSLVALWGRHITSADLAADADLRGALTGLSEANAQAFAAANPIDSNIMVQSWAGVSSVLGKVRDADLQACEGKLVTFKERSDRMDARLVPIAAVVAHGADLIPNDGMSTVDSAKFGTFRGCVPANHYAEVGQPKRTGADSWSGWDHVRFYRTVAFDLAKQGF